MNGDMEEIRRMRDALENLNNQQKERVNELYAMVEGYHIVFKRTLRKLNEKRKETDDLLIDVKRVATQLVDFAVDYRNIVKQTIRQVLLWVLGISFFGGSIAMGSWYLILKYFLA